MKCSKCDIETKQLNGLLSFKSLSHKAVLFGTTQEILKPLS